MFLKKTILMIVYFQIDELNRDTVVASALKKEFKKKGILLFYGNRLITNIIAKLKINFLFDKYILPSAFFAKFLDKNLRLKNNDINILFTEGNGAVLDGNERSSYHFFGCAKKDIAKNVPILKKFRYLLFGKKSLKKCLQLCNSLKENFIIVGYPRADKSIVAISKKNKIRDNLKRIGILTRQDILNPYDQRSPIKQLHNFSKINNPYWKDEDKKLNVEDIYFLAANDLRVTIDLLYYLKSNNLSALLRPHPRENLNYWLEIKNKYFKNLNISLNPSETIQEWFAKVDTVITFSSTAIYDALLCNKNIILLDDLNIKRRNHLLKVSDDQNMINNFLFKPKKISNINYYLKSKKNPNLKNENIKKILKFECDFPNSMNSISKIVDLYQPSKKKFLYLKYFAASLVIYMIQCLYCLFNINNKKKIKQNSSIFILFNGLKNRIDNLV